MMNLMKWTILFLLISYCTVFSLSPILLRYQNLESNQVYYKMSSNSDINGRRQGAELVLLMRNNKDEEGKIHSRLSFYIMYNGEKKGPFLQDMYYNILGNIREKDTEERLTGDYIALEPFFVQFPKNMITEGIRWKAEERFTLNDGEDIKVLISNEIKKIDTEKKICYIDSKGMDKGNGFYFLRKLEFDYKNGNIVYSKIKIGEKKEEKRFLGEIEIRKVDK